MSAELNSLTVEYAFLCEDARREDNGKLMLIGVFANNILLGEFPGQLRLRLIMRLHPKKAEFPLHIRVRFDGEDALFIRGSMTSSALEAELSPSPEIGVKFSKPGLLEFHVSDEPFEDVKSAEKVRWTPVMAIPVAQMA